MNQDGGRNLASGGVSDPGGVGDPGSGDGQSGPISSGDNPLLPLPDPLPPPTDVSDLPVLQLPSSPFPSDILNTNPQLPVWGPCPTCQAGCTGAGIPCTMSQAATTPPPSSPYDQAAYKYTIYDVNNNVVTAVTQVNDEIEEKWYG